MPACRAAPPGARYPWRAMKPAMPAARNAGLRRGWPARSRRPATTSTSPGSAAAARRIASAGISPPRPNGRPPDAPCRVTSMVPAARPTRRSGATSRKRSAQRAARPTSSLWATGTPNNAVMPEPRRRSACRRIVPRSRRPRPADVRSPPAPARDPSRRRGGSIRPRRSPAGAARHRPPAPALRSSQARAGARWRRAAAASATAAARPARAPANPGTAGTGAAPPRADPAAHKAASNCGGPIPAAGRARAAAARRRLHARCARRRHAGRAAATTAPAPARARAGGAAEPIVECRLACVERLAQLAVPEQAGALERGGLPSSTRR